MTETEECPHGLEPAWCSTCKHGPTRPAPRVVTYGGLFRSRYEGTRCAACGDTGGRIDAGELIRARFVDDQPAGYVHADEAE